MSLFSAFSQKGLAVFTNTMESLSNIVAPVPEDDSDSIDNSNIDGENETEDDMSFTERMQSFISSKRDDIVANTATDDSLESPSSFTDVDLNDCTPPVTNTQHTKPTLSIPSNNAFNTATFLSNDELERTVNTKYRESLEVEISLIESRHRDSEDSWTDQLKTVQTECDHWKALATTAKKKEIELLAKFEDQLNNEAVCHMCAHHERRLKDTSTSLEEATEASEQLTNQVAELSEQLERLQGELFASTEEKQHLILLNGELRSKCADVEIGRDDVLVELTAARQQITSQTQNDEASISAAEGRYSEMLQVNAQLRSTIATLESEHAKTITALLAAQEQILVLTTQLNTVHTTEEEESAELSPSHSHQIAALTNELGLVKTALIAAEQQKDESHAVVVNSLRGELAKLCRVNEDLSDRMENFGTIQTELISTSAALASERTSVLALTEQLRQCTSQVDALTRQVQSIDSERLRLDEALTSSEASLQEMEGLASAARMEAAELLFALELEQSKVGALAASESRLKDELLLLHSSAADLAHSRQSENRSVESVASSDDALLMDITAALQSSLRLLHSLVCTYEGEAVVAPSSDSQPEAVSAALKLKNQTALLDIQLNALAAVMKAGFENNERTHVALTEASSCILRCEMTASSSVKSSGGASSRRLSASADKKSVSQDNSERAEALRDMVSGLIERLSEATQANEILTTRIESDMQDHLQTQEETWRATSQVVAELDASKLVAATTAAEIASLHSSNASALQQIERLTKEVHAVRLAGEQRVSSVLEEKGAAEKELQRVQGSASDGNSQLVSLRNDKLKFETENRQLHQVISQLRQARKTTKGEEEGAMQERDELRAATTAQLAEIVRLERALSGNVVNSETVVKLRSELSNSSNKIALLEQALGDAKRQLSTLESSYYHKEAQLDIATSDVLLVRQDLEQRGQEVRNLMEALSQVERDRAGESGRLERELAEKTRQMQQTYEENHRREEMEWGRRLTVAEEARRTAEQQSEDHQLFRRKAELDFNAEKKRVQKTLESALQQLNNSQQDVIDRTLVANLLVSYFKRRRSSEVMELIAKVLSFSDEQKVAVGLRVAPTNLISSLFATVIGGGGARGGDDADSRHDVEPVEGDNLAEQWINFLITQSEENGSSSSGGVTSPKNSSSASPKHVR